MKNEVFPIKNNGVMKVLKNNMTPEELEAQAAQLLEQAKADRREAEQERNKKLDLERDADMNTLATSRDRLRELDTVSSLAGKLTLDDAKALAKERQTLVDGIREIEEKYGMSAPRAEAEPETVPSSNAVLITTLKIAALLMMCWGIVLYSGDWILTKYPQAAVYNEVSFQKILFAFSVFIGGLVTVIMALGVFFPGFGRYFNPFNRSEIDFFEDFQKLNEWQRNLIALALFACLLFCFVLVAAGKLD